MAKPLAVKRVYAALRQYEHKRPDLGFGKGLLDVVLEPASPFDHKGKRSPKRWFVWLVMLAASTVGCFIYFNSVTIVRRAQDLDQRRIATTHIVLCAGC